MLPVLSWLVSSSQYSAKLLLGAHQLKVAQMGRCRQHNNLTIRLQLHFIRVLLLASLYRQQLELQLNNSHCDNSAICYLSILIVLHNGDRFSDRSARSATVSLHSASRAAKPDWTWKRRLKPEPTTALLGRLARLSMLFFSSCSSSAGPSPGCTNRPLFLSKSSKVQRHLRNHLCSDSLELAA